MRIALVITELDPGGAELCLTELALYLSAAGHTVKVLAMGPPPPSGRDELWQRLQTNGIDVSFGNARGMAHALSAAVWLRRQLNAFRPDVVQSMLWHANVITASALWWNRVPWVGGMRVSEPRRGRYWIERVASRRMQRLVCVSQDVMRHACEQQGIDRSKLLVIPNGVRDGWLEGQTNPKTWHELEGLAGWQPALRRVLLFVGRLEPQKGVLQLIEHAPSLLTEHSDWSLVLIGSGSLHAELKKRIDALSLNAQVHLVGWQPQAPSWMKAADIVLLPAVYEGMPNVILEAMAVGKPFVSFAVDGLKQLVSGNLDDSSTLAQPQLAQPGDWSQFIAKARTMMDRASLRDALGQANRQHIAQHFRLTDQLAKYLALYEELAGSPNTINSGG